MNCGKCILNINGSKHNIGKGKKLVFSCVSMCMCCKYTMHPMAIEWLGTQISSVHHSHAGVIITIIW